MSNYCTSLVPRIDVVSDIDFYIADNVVNDKTLIKSLSHHVQNECLLPSLDDYFFRSTSSFSLVPLFNLEGYFPVKQRLKIDVSGL